MALLDLLIIGGGGFARELSAWADNARWGSTRFHVIGFVDDVNPGRTMHGRPVMRLNEVRKTDKIAFVVAMGDPALRERLVDDALAFGLKIAPPLVHPTVMLDRRFVGVGDGTVICFGCALTTEISIGCHVQLNLQCSVGHDVQVGDYATLAPGVHISGRVNVDRGAYLGTGAATIAGQCDRYLHIGEKAVVGAGAVVVRDVPPATTVFGVPAHVLARTG